ncbi:nucleotide disphospho-sugar-binding domain-containing protein [Streptomyces sp. NPDC001315]|uniref:nucleotide disphospho-sugar-binding domain-containing protein n=1 Tax=Streptomyces sp. NPDC001315 TaxID=3364562 RepID=UPI003682F33E
MRVLMMSTPVPTHFTPLVPLAWALRAAGHEVLVAGQPDVLGAVASAGLNATGVGTAFHVQDLLMAGLRPGERPLETRTRAELEQMGGPGRVWTTHARYMWQSYLEVAREFRPDLVVSDPLEFSATIVGAVLGVPVVQHRWGVDPYSGGAQGEAAVVLRALCERLGLDGMPQATVLLDPCPPGLQLPDVAQGTGIRHVAFNGNGQLPQWLRELKPVGGTVRRVAVSLGSRTLDLNALPFTRRMLRALGERPGTEIVATVDAHHRGELGPLPDSVRLVDPVPLSLLLGVCDAAVHHGGAGTSMTVTSFGLPQLVLPQLADQFAHADRLAAAGAAIALDSAETQNDPERLRDAVDDLLTAPAYAKAADGLARAMADMPSPSDVVADLENLR